MFQFDPENQQMAWVEPYPNYAYVKKHRYVAPEMLFPLKKTLFCGKEVRVPNQTRSYLEMHFKDLAPHMVWSNEKQEYVGVESHITYNAQKLFYNP